MIHALISLALLASPEKQVEFHGVVSGPKGPEAGALVKVWAPETHGLAARECVNELFGTLMFHCGCGDDAKQLVPLLDHPPQPLATATTGADGSFSVRGAFPANALLEATSASGLAAAHVTDGAATLKLEPATGFVVPLHGERGEKAGDPQQHVQVVAYANWTGAVTAATVSNGSATFPPLPPGPYTLIARAPGVPMDAFEVTETGANNSFQAHLPGNPYRGALPPVQLTLGAPSSVAVRAMAGKKPVAGAEVEVVGEPCRASGRTRADGTLKLDALPSGTYQVRVKSPAASGELQVTAGPQVDVPLLPRQTVTVKVLERGSKQPIAGAWINATHPQPFHHDSCKTDAAGTCRLERLTAATYSITASAPRRLLTGAVEFPAATPGKQATFLAERGVPIRGHVVDEAGKPVAGASLRLLVSDDAKGDVAALTEELKTHAWTSDATGAFLLEEAPPGKYELEGQSALHFMSSVELEAPTGDAVLKLETRPQLHGRVQDEQGQPLADVDVTVKLTAKGSGSQRSISARSNAKGEFVVALEKLGAFTVSASRMGPSWTVLAEAKEQAVTVTADSPPLVLTLRPPAKP